MASFLRKFWPTLIVVCVIVYATWFPGDMEPDKLPDIPHLDKLIHAVMFGGFAGAVMFDIRRSGSYLNRPNILLVAIISVIFAVADEWIQGLLPIHRPSDWLDLVADGVGIIIALATAPAAVNAIFKQRN